MKRLILVAAALATLVAPASAFAQPQDWKHHRAERVDRKVVVHKNVVVHRDVVVRRNVVVKPRWVVGHRIPTATRYVVVTDYGRYHLRRPAFGQHWVRVDNRFLLVGIGNGIIAAFAN